MNLSCTTTEYEDNHDCVSWRGHSFSVGGEFDGFLQEKVRSRLDDAEGSEDFRSHLRGLELTGIGKATLEAFLAAEAPEERDWAAGEALAEAFSMETRWIVFPWNMKQENALQDCPTYAGVVRPQRPSPSSTQLVITFKQGSL
jgi:hypothetical protein